MLRNAGASPCSTTWRRYGSASPWRAGMMPQNGLHPGKLFDPMEIIYIYIYMGVSKNRGTPKWMVYDGKPYQNG